MTFLRTIARQWRLLLAAAVAGAIVHIWSTLAAMEQQVMPGYARLVRGLPVNQITFLPQITPQNQPLPFLMPDSLYSICRFDASEASIRLTAELPEAGWSLSLHAPNGNNYYFVPGTDRRVTKLDLILQTAGSAFLTSTDAEPQRRAERPKVLLPDPRGIAVLRTPVRGLAYRRLSDELRGKFTCRPMTGAH